jgi:hypothetical protein
MEWEQASKVLVGVGTILILIFTLVIVFFMINLKRRLNSKQHFIENLERNHQNEVSVLKDKICTLEAEIQKLRTEKVDKPEA